MRILLVEDNRDILANMADYLGLKGYTVDCAQDGLSGLHLAATAHYDLIVLDVMLPGLDGFTLCRRLREDARRDTPVIMLTARDQLDDRLQGFRSGADDYLLKPFALSELAARIEAVLRILPPGCRLAVDANGRFDLDTAIAYAKAIRGYDLFWYEEAGDPLDTNCKPGWRSTIPARWRLAKTCSRCRMRAISSAMAACVPIATGCNSTAR